MKPVLLSAALAVALAGCSPPGFSRLGVFQLDFFGGAVGSGMLDYNTTQMGCQTMDGDFAVTVNGVEAEVVRGGKPPFSVLGIGASCLPPLFNFAVPDATSEHMVVRVTAADQEVTAEIEHVEVVLTGTPILSPGQVVHVGDRVQIQLGGRFDLVQLAPASATQSVGNMSNGILMTDPSADGVFEAQLSDRLPPGQTRLAFAATVEPTITSCGAPGGCHWFHGFELSRRLEVTLEVAP
jgi:hypothetical protein